VLTTNLEFQGIARRHARWLLVLIGLAAPALSAETESREPRPKSLRTVTALQTPESVLALADGRILVSQIGEFGRDGDGSIAQIDKSGRVSIFASGLDDPRGLAREGDYIYVADKTRIWKIDNKGRTSVFVEAKAFPAPPQVLNDLAIDPSGNLYVSDSGDVRQGGGGGVFKVDREGRVSTVLTSREDGRIKSPNGLAVDRGSLLTVDFATGELLRLGLNPGRIIKKIADGFGGGEGLAIDEAGHAYVSDWKGGRVFRVDVTKSPAQVSTYPQKFQASSDIAFDASRKFILVPDMKAGSLTWLPVR
jgi:gluconolactonase